ncbi:MAG: GNAT family N-acetyltransferase [Acidobacteriota bacterium]|nr:GNAT family N-acetyltransferase [Acidobacteriota bacterium]MDQ7086496.1 GNAT family N-acetyltransferase [Acidobacteriota bacterium]
MPPVSPQRALSRLAQIAERSRPWRYWGRRHIVPALRILRADEDPRGAWRQVYGDFAARRNLDRTLEHTWLAVHRHRALGGLMLHPRGDDLLLHTMRVRRPYRGLGVGGWLLDRILADADRSGRRIWLQVRHDNRPAIGLYSSRGFRVTREDPAFFRDGHLVMKRDPRGGPADSGHS